MMDVITAADKADQSKGKRKWARQYELQMQEEIKELEQARVRRVY